MGEFEGGGQNPTVAREAASSAQPGKPESGPDAGKPKPSAVPDTGPAASKSPDAAASSTGTTSSEATESVADAEAGTPDTMDAGSPVRPIDETTGDAHADLTRIAGETKDAPEQPSLPDRNKQLATTLLDRETARLQARIDNGLNIQDQAQVSDEAYDLYVYRQFKEGFPEGSYAKEAKLAEDGTTIIEEAKPGMKIDGGLTATDTDGNDVAVLYVTEGKSDDDGKRVYSCLVKDPADKNKTITVAITGEELASRHLKRSAESIAKNFSGDAQKAVRWYANGSEGDPPLTAQEVTNVEDSLKPEKVADDALDGQMKYVTGKVDAYTKELASLQAAGVREDDKRWQDVQAKLERAQRVSEQISLARQIQGGRQMLHAKDTALQSALAYADEQGDKVLLRHAEVARENLKYDLDAETDKFKISLKDLGVPDEVIKLADDPTTYNELLTHPEVVKKIPDIAQELFGMDEVGMQELVNSANINDQAKDRLKKALKDNDKLELWKLILEIIAGTTAAAIAASSDELAKGFLKGAA